MTLRPTALDSDREQALDMIVNSDNYPSCDIIEILVQADADYAADNSFLEDNEYDALYLIATRLDPANVYFTGVGSEVRGGKIKLPFQMGSLNQVEIGDIEEWVQKHNLKNEKMIVTDKMDGTSALILYSDDGLPQIAYSRGNGTEGADISRHIFKIKNVPQKVSGKMVVRVEVELTETAFAELNTKLDKEYKNARNMIAGIMNRKENPAIVWDYVTVIAYQVVGSEEHKLDQLDELEREGFDVTPYAIYDGYELNDEMLSKYLNGRRDGTDYAIDGIVIDVNSRQKRAQMNPSKDTLNPEYSIKYKVADDSNYAIVEVVGVTWNVSKHGFLKPQVNLVPTDLVGVTISNATGFNAKYILDNGIGAGAKIALTRSGDVIPFITAVIEAVAPDMPRENCEWNDTGVELVLVDKDDNDEVVINQNIDFFSKIEAPMLKEGSIRKLFNEGFDSPAKIIRHLGKDDAVLVLGKNGEKVYDGLHAKLAVIPAYKLLGAFSTERGMGVRKFKKLQKVVGLDALLDNSVTRSQIIGAEGFDEKSADKVLTTLNAFVDFLAEIDGYYTFEVEVAVVAGGAMEGMKVVFTGFRDVDLQAAIEAAGGEMQSGVSAKTTILVTKDPTSTSGKVQKARDKGVMILGIDDIKDMV